MGKNLLLDLSQYVRVTQMTGKDIRGRYDGVDYVFKHDTPEDVGLAVAQHVFGFGLPDSAEPPFADKTQALMRLGWLASGDSSDVPLQLHKLKAAVRFSEVTFPSVTPLHRESVARVPPSTMGVEDGEASHPVEVTAVLEDPFAKPKNGKGGKTGS